MLNSIKKKLWHARAYMQNKLVALLKLVGLRKKTIQNGAKLNVTISALYEDKLEQQAQATAIAEAIENSPSARKARRAAASKARKSRPLRKKNRNKGTSK